MAAQLREVLKPSKETSFLGCVVKVMLKDKPETRRKSFQEMFMFKTKEELLLYALVTLDHQLSSPLIFHKTSKLRCCI